MKIFKDRLAIIQTRNAYTNIILHMTAHFRGQINKTEARLRPMLKAEANLSRPKSRLASKRSVWLKWLRIAGLFDRYRLVRCRQWQMRRPSAVSSSCQLVNAMIPSLIALLTWQLAAWLAFALVEPRPRTRFSISKQLTRYNTRVRLMLPIFLRVETYLK